MTPSAQPVAWPGPRHFCAALLSAAVGFGVSYMLATRVAPPLMAAYVVAFGCVTASALAAAACAPRTTRARLAFAGPAVAALLLASVLGVSAWSSLLVLLALLTLGPLIGAGVGSRIEHPGHLLFVAIVSAFADVFSVVHPEGPSALLAKSKPALSLLAVPWPMLGTERIEAVLGVGDVVFAGLYLSASRAHRLSMSRTLVALLAAFALAMLVVIATELPVPVLPFMGLMVVAVHRQARTPPAKDRKPALALLLALCAVFTALLLYRFS